MIPVLTVYENVEYLLIMVRGVGIKDRKKKVMELIEEVGIGAEKTDIMISFPEDKNNFRLELRARYFF